MLVVFALVGFFLDKLNRCDVICVILSLRGVT